eukprot:TRINITY_DN3129_c0_g1_i1.p1 TRINITY_DN3129_c0_g1~~TRINITY_DN3129_c0_g1_i1.p1  ORF type:complete len:203 (-),score=35.28 TRINITY_DN3129_c0_g1_i1:37-645(-)
MVGTLAKEFRDINRSSVFDNEATIVVEEDILDWSVILHPTKGHYIGGDVHFTIKFHADYPNSCPEITCKSPIWHPNISESGRVCLSMLSGDWSADYRAEHYINGLLWLIYNPNLSDALNRKVNGPSYRRHFAEIAAGSVRGLSPQDVLNSIRPNKPAKRYNVAVELPAVRPANFIPSNVQSAAPIPQRSVRDLIGFFNQVVY